MSPLKVLEITDRVGNLSISSLQMVDRRLQRLQQAFAEDPEYCKDVTRARKHVCVELESRRGTNENGTMR